MNLYLSNHLTRVGLVALTLGALCSTSAVIAESVNPEHRGVVVPSSPPPPNVLATEINAFGAANIFGGVNTNFIDPVKKKKSTAYDGAVYFIPDECGTTCFSGNVAVNPYKQLLVNQINPVKLDPTDPTMKKYIQDETGVTCFSGVLGANEINPTKSVPRLVNGKPVVDPCTQKNQMVCVVDDSLGAKTVFSGDIQVRDKHILGEVGDIVLGNYDTPVLKLTFPAGPQQGAYVKFYFNALATENSYEVLYLGEYYINTAGSSIIKQSTRSAINECPDRVNAWFYPSGTGDVTIFLNICTEGIQYGGCLHYQIVGCESLLSIECKPETIIT